MQAERKCVTMSAEPGGFFCCPYCDSKLIRTTPTTEAERLPVWCRKCKREILIDIHRGQSARSRSPGQSDND